MFNVSKWVAVLMVVGCANTSTPPPSPVDTTQPGTNTNPPPYVYDSGTQQQQQPPEPQDSGYVPPAAPDAGQMTQPPVPPAQLTPQQECMMQATNMCEQCGCNNCLTQLQACERDPGCIAIRDCARRTGCRGIDCYGFLNDGPCKQVIEANGGLIGASTTQASAVSDCFTGSCPGC